MVVRPPSGGGMRRPRGCRRAAATGARERSPQRLDVLIVGSGVAGLSAAVRLAQRGAARVGVLTKGGLEQSTTRWAQGGIAAVLAGDEDSTDLHLADTLRAGAGLCDQAAVRVLVDEGSVRVHELIALGAVFDRVPDGGLSRARRAATRRLECCTRAVPPPVRRSSGRLSPPSARAQPQSWRTGSPSISPSWTAAARGWRRSIPKAMCSRSRRPK